jgi:hypothetical protein
LPVKGFGEGADKAQRFGEGAMPFFDILSRPSIIPLFRWQLELDFTIPSLFGFAGDNRPYGGGMV